MKKFKVRLYRGSIIKEKYLHKEDILYAVSIENCAEMAKKKFDVKNIVHINSKKIAIDIGSRADFVSIEEIVDKK